MKIIILAVGIGIFALLGIATERRDKKVDKKRAEGILLFKRPTALYWLGLAGAATVSWIIVSDMEEGLLMSQIIMCTILFSLGMGVAVSSLARFWEVYIDHNTITVRRLFVFSKQYQFSEITHCDAIKNGLMVYVRQADRPEEKKAFFVNGKTDYEYLFLGRIVEYGIKINDMESEEGDKFDIAQAYYALKNKNDILEKIIKALNAKDEMALKDLFSREARSKTPALDEQITSCFAFAKNEITGFFHDTYWIEPDDDILAGEWLIGEYTLRNKAEYYRLRYDYADRGTPEEIGLRRLEIGSIDFYRNKTSGAMIRHWQYTNKEAGIYIASVDQL